MKRPQVHIWTILYFLLGTAPFLLLCLWAVKDGWFPSEKVLMKHPDPSDHFYSFNQSLAVISGLLAFAATLPAWIVILGKQKSWVWMTTLVFIAIGMTQNALLGIPILIFWIRDSNKSYYGQVQQQAEMSPR